MASVENINHLGRRRQPSRLQRRVPAPASIQINPLSEWNVAIPLLSPLDLSPDNLTAEIKSSEKPVAVVVMKTWQHPAAPFCYQPTPFLPFACTGSF
ncbi:hypothetical protein PHJA_000723200 [Phtheirospermum japonicum]|uniref:Uncharacterized protein n=1 Tax=Phtheirospermum japonicum TaxID=374723 RepID=A0A830BPP5_9LAMI|nr:hypothetical protein PHJA_000723200 [Phtheirospermum japonicum]